MHKGKQYSFWHKLPKSKDKIISIMPRNILKNKEFFNQYNVKVDFSLLLLIIHKLTNVKTSEITSPFIEIKRSTLRNFIGKKIHSKKVFELDLQIENFLNTLSSSTIKTLYSEKTGNSLIFSFDISFYKKLLSGNTVSFNLLDYTSIRGEKAKKTFLNILCYDLRVSDKFIKLSNAVNYLSLDFEKRKSNIGKIKRALKSLAKKGIIEYIGYEYNSSFNNFKFNYKLKNLLQY